MAKKLFSLESGRWTAVLCALTACYVLFVIYTMVKTSQVTQELHDYPYAVSLEAREMKARLYGMRSTLPALLATPDLPYAEVEAVLQTQEKEQNAAITRLRAYYRGDAAEMAAFDRELDDLRRARRRAARATAYVEDLETAEAIYRREVLPYLEKLDRRLTSIAASADRRGTEMMAKMDRARFASIVVALFMGALIIWLIIYSSRRERAANREIANREKLFKALAVNIDETFFVFRAGDACEYVSPNSGRTLGLPAEDVRQNGGRLYAFLGPEAGGWLRSVLRDGSLRQPVEREVSPEGLSRRFRVRVYPIRQEGKSERRIVVFEDQTDILAQRQALSDALENARNANAAKSHFLSRMSHEIRTPMNAIIGMTAIALNRLGDTARTGDCLTKIAQSSRHLLHLVNDVLDMSKIEGGKVSVAREPFDFRLSLQSVATLFETQTRERGQHFEISLHGVDEEQLCGDALRLNQILINILSNAVKFTPAGGSVRLDVRQLRKKNGTVLLRFVIRDTGIGMSPDFLARLYEPFEQAASAAGSASGGTGLGMAITKNLVSLLGGTIAVKSEEGKGTEFTVELPFGLTGRRQPGGEGLEPLKVLVVDDDLGTCEHAALLLERMGLHVEWVLSGEEAVTLVVRAYEQGESYDVCLVDWKMPGMDGVETIRRLREKVGPDTLIIIVSAYDWSEIESEARKAGADAFISKPFFASTLHDALLAATRRPSASGGEEKASPAYDFSGKRLLLVEDNEINREVAEELLGMTGASVDCAQNGKEAVDAFAAAGPGLYDAILMDVQMPVMDGYAATRAIRASAHPEAKSVPIIAMTANAFSEDIAAAREAGMDGHIAKPIDMDALCRVLRACLGGKGPEEKAAS